MMAALSWLHTSPDAPSAMLTNVDVRADGPFLGGEKLPRAMLKDAEARADEAPSTLTKTNTSAMPKPASADLTKPDMAEPVDPLREARASLFRDKGVSTIQAERFADILAERDHTLDDRRACLECASFHDGRCLQGRYPLGRADIFTLHRCVGFKPNEVSHD